MLPIEVFADEMGNARRAFAVLSGPNHAEEVVRGMPVGHRDRQPRSRETAAFLPATLFAAPTRSAPTSADDVAGVELCAAFKNVIAIAVGLCYGLGYRRQHRGHADDARPRRDEPPGGDARAAQPLTCMGLAGTGDLIATCTSRALAQPPLRRDASPRARRSTISRTRRTWWPRARSPARPSGRWRRTTAWSCPSPRRCAAVVWEGAEPKEIGRALADRPLTTEFYGI